MTWAGEAWGEAPWAAFPDEGSPGAVLNATLPMLTGDLAATVTPIGAAVASLPALTAALFGGGVPAGAVLASLPALTAVLVSAQAPATGVVAASLPQLEAAIVATTSARQALRSWQQCPRPTSGFASCGPVGSLREGPQE